MLFRLHFHCPILRGFEQDNLNCMSWWHFLQFYTFWVLFSLLPIGFYFQPFTQDLYASILMQEGFWYHHAEPTYVMLTYWIPATAHTLPVNATHRVGVGAFVINGKREVYYDYSICFVKSISPQPSNRRQMATCFIFLFKLAIQRNCTNYNLLDKLEILYAGVFFNYNLLDELEILYACVFFFFGLHILVRLC